MPAPLTPSRRGARRGLALGRTTLASAVVAALAATGACSSPGARDTAAAVRTGASAVSTGAATMDATTTDAVHAAAVAEIAELLRRRATALVAADEPGYVATLADPASVEGRRQLAAYTAARALRVSRLEVGPVDVDLAVGSSAAPAPPPNGPEGERSDPGTASPYRARANAEVRYRIDDLDRGDRIARLDYTLARSGSGWAVVTERPHGSGATAPWVAMPGLRVERGAQSVVAGTASQASLAEHVAVVDRALPSMRRQWPGTPGRVLVLAPATPEEADALLGRSVGAAVGDVAATTEGPTGPRGTATGDRVVLDPTAYARLTAAGRDVVLTHELAHVAVRATVPGRTATWLAEGYADHVGYARAGISAERLLAPLLAEVRAGRGPLDLPSGSHLQPATGDIEVPYLAAWQAVELVVAEHGEDALRRLVVAGSSTGSDADAEAATDRALLSVLGTSRSELTRALQARLRGLAG